MACKPRTKPRLGQGLTLPFLSAKEVLLKANSHLARQNWLAGSIRLSDCCCSGGHKATPWLSWCSCWPAAEHHLCLVWCLEQMVVGVLQGWCEVCKEELPPGTVSVEERGIMVVGEGRQRGLDRLAACFCWWRVSHLVQKSPSLLKDCGKIKLEGVVIIVDQKTLIGFPVAFVKGRGQMLAVLLILPAQETSVTRALESDKYKAMSYRRIAGEMTVSWS